MTNIFGQPRVCCNPVYGKLLVIQFPYFGYKKLIIDLWCKFLYLWNCMKSV